MPKKADPLAAWRSHIKAHQKKNPGLSLKETLQGAKLTYTKPKKAQEVGEEAARQSVTGKAKSKRKPKVCDC